MVGGDADRLGDVNLQAGGVSKNLENNGDSRKLDRKVDRANGGVVSVESDLAASVGSEKPVKDVHNKEEEKRGERATLLHTRFKVDLVKVVRKEGSHAVGIVKESRDDVVNLVPQTNGGDQVEEKAVGDRVERFADVDEGNIIITATLQGAVEALIEVANVGIYRTVVLEAVLVRRENGANRRIDEVVDHRGDDPVVSVVDNQGTGVFN
jgi:hypothetical protein